MSDFSIVLPADLIPREKYGARTEAIGKRHIEKAPPLFSTDIINRLYPYRESNFCCCNFRICKKFVQTDFCSLQI